MSKGKSKKKKIAAAVIAAVLSLILCSGIGVYIWYSNSPFPTVVKMMSALKEKDIDTILECIEPETSRTISMLFNLTGISADDLVDMLLPVNWDNGSNERPQTESLSFEFAGYEQDGDTARISLKAALDGASANIEINFVRISGIWYLSLG